MKNTIVRTILALTLIFSFANITRADSQSYTPPPKKGTVYLKVRFKAYNSRDQFPKTKVSVRWGSFSRTKSYGTSASLNTTGVIISLKHTNNDSVEITAETDGTIEYLRQAASPPSTVGWYQKDSW